MILIPLIVIVLSFVGIKNLEREYSRFLEWIAVIEKLREKLGLYQEINIKKSPDDKYLETVKPKPALQYFSHSRFIELNQRNNPYS